MVTMRSAAEMNPERTLSSVVLPEPVPPGDDDVEPRADRAAKDFEHLRRQRAMAQQVVGGQRNGAEAANRQQRAIHGKRRNDDVDARSIEQARIHHGRRLIDAAAHRGDDLVDDVHQVSLVLEHNVGLLDHSAPLHIDGLVGVDQNVVHGGIVQQRLERAEAEDLVENVVRQPVAIRRAERSVLFRDQLQDDGEQPLPPALFVGLDGRKLLQIHAADEFMMDGGLERVARRIAKRDADLGNGHWPRRRSHVHRYFGHWNHLDPFGQTIQRPQRRNPNNPLLFRWRLRCR